MWVSQKPICAPSLPGHSKSLNPLSQWSLPSTEWQVAVTMPQVHMELREAAHPGPWRWEAMESGVASTALGTTPPRYGHSQTSFVQMQQLEKQLWVKRWPPVSSWEPPAFLGCSLVGKPHQGCSPCQQPPIRAHPKSSPFPP